VIPPVLTDGVVTLRGFVPEDAPVYAELNRDPVNVEWAGSDPRMSAASALAAFRGPVAAGWRSGNELRLAIVGPSGSLAGTTALHSVRSGAASVGIKLAAGHRGQGLGLRSVRLLIRFAFEDLALTVLHWHAAAGNEASRTLALKAGFRLEGTVRGYALRAGRPVDGLVFSRASEDGDPLDLEPVVPTLTDGSVTLRAVSERDIPGLVENCRDPEAVRWTTVPVDYSITDARRFVYETAPAGWRAGSQQYFAVAEAGTDALLGTIGLHAFRAGTAEVGINLGPAARGTGAAEKASRLLIGYAFEQLNLQYLYWQVLLPNWRSRKLAWKLGFRLEAGLRGYAVDRGRAADIWILSLARTDPRVPSTPWDGPNGQQGSDGRVT
jgi:RimJ/RimL family protein N-acetyltransferase